MFRVRHLKAAWNTFQLFAFALGMWADVAEGGNPSSGKPLKARDIIWKFSQGNAKFMEESSIKGYKRKFSYKAMVNQLIEDPLNPVRKEAIILSDARSWSSVDQLLYETEPGSIQAIRVSGCVCRAHDRFDGVLASLEYALMQPNPPPLLLVMANAKNAVIEDAVRLASSSPTGAAWESSKLVQEVLPAAEDAILQDPDANFDDLCDITARLNVWNTIETLLTTSRVIFDAVKSGTLEVHGAFRDDTGKIQFMGEHPMRKSLMEQRPVIVRTAKDPAVPASEAFAMLYAGNKRYIKGNSLGAMYIGGARNKQLTQHGQSPYAVILGCADARAPPELLFDARPGNLFILRTAGNTFNAGKSSILGSAEYAVDHLRSNLVVVMGHTNCGAVTAAVDATASNADLKDVPGSIGLVLADLQRDAAHSVTDFPNADKKTQILEASKFNVFTTMEKILKNSPIIAEGVRKSEVQVHGSLYDIESGEVMWLGQHPKVAEIVGKPLPVHEWKNAPYVRARPPDKFLASREIQLLREGNDRFRRGDTRGEKAEHTDDPWAIIVSGSELRIPIEDVFDISPGGVVVQRSMGTIAGHKRNILFDSLEYNVQRFSPKLLLVLGASDSGVINTALKHTAGEATGFGPTHVIHEAVCSSALAAILQTSTFSGTFGKSAEVVTSAGRDMKCKGLTVELNALYTVENLLRHSEVLRNAVKAGKLEIQVGILQEDTGKVEFIGNHPMQDELVKCADSHSLIQVASTNKRGAGGVTALGDVVKKAKSLRRFGAFLLFMAVATLK